jgi:hypothetical protein
MGTELGCQCGPGADSKVFHISPQDFLASFVEMLTWEGCTCKSSPVHIQSRKMQSFGKLPPAGLWADQTHVVALQVGQLLLDPAVQRQFRGSLVEMEGMSSQAKGLQDELQAVQFSQDSKAGRMLMAKCRALQVCSGKLRLDLASQGTECRRRSCAECHVSNWFSVQCTHVSHSLA